MVNKYSINLLTPPDQGSDKLLIFLVIQGMAIEKEIACHRDEVKKPKQQKQG